MAEADYPKCKTTGNVHKIKIHKCTSINIEGTGLTKGQRRTGKQRGEQMDLNTQGGQVNEAQVKLIRVIKKGGNRKKEGSVKQKMTQEGRTTK